MNESERKWNLMWKLWVDGDAASPYAELMEYDCEVNNGGHEQYFVNLDIFGAVYEEVNKILPILPEPLRENLKKGVEAFSKQEETFTNANDAVLEECDNFFYKNEQLLLDILKVYANSLTL